jgi:hypothetical protein
MKSLYSKLKQTCYLILHYIILLFFIVFDFYYIFSLVELIKYFSRNFFNLINNFYIFNKNIKTLLEISIIV